MEYKAKILKISQLTQDVKSFILEKPEGFKYLPGYAAIFSINKSGWEGERRAFSFVSSPHQDNLEIIAKLSLENKGVTRELFSLKEGDELLISSPIVSARYKREGIFIAGGVGIAPFLSIFRSLAHEGKAGGNILLYSDKSKSEIIFEKEIRKIFGKNAFFFLTREKVKGYINKRIGEENLKSFILSPETEVYVCGPPEFTKDMKQKSSTIKESLIKNIIKN